jgi:LysR family transcriptional regulator, regulator for bpeEF and oprC
MDRFLFMQCFVRAVETGSFSAVARELGTGQPNVSRHTQRSAAGAPHRNG